MINRSIISICIFSYNYEQFISQAIDSALQQNLTVPFEILIGDDFSTDNTRQVVLKYQQQYPEIIKISFNEKNMGGTYNWINSMNKCSGRYIALLDGDDYFTSKDKLQRQYDALEKDSEAVLCFHAIEEKYDDVKGMDKIVRFEKDIFTIEDFLSRGWFIRTGSTFFRNHILPEKPPEWVYDFPYRYDTIMHVFLGSAGHAIYIDEPMSVWRKHLKGMSFKLRENINENILSEIAMAQRLNVHTNHRHNELVNNYVAELYSGLFFNLLKTGIGSSNIMLFLKSMIQMDRAKSFKRLKSNLLN